VKFRPRTEEHDYETKIRKIREFLEESNKARVTVMFRGRELSHRELGTKVLERIVADLKEVAVIEASARMEGRQMFMILAPNPRMLQSQRDKAKAAAAAAAAGTTPPPAPPAPAAEPPPAAGPAGSEGGAA
jgi:translation initiation factor IF-3